MSFKKEKKEPVRFIHLLYLSYYDIDTYIYVSMGLLLESSLILKRDDFEVGVCSKFVLLLFFYLI